MFLGWLSHPGQRFQAEIVVCPEGSLCILLEEKLKHTKHFKSYLEQR